MKSRILGDDVRCATYWNRCFMPGQRTAADASDATARFAPDSDDRREVAHDMR